MTRIEKKNPHIKEYPTTCISVEGPNKESPWGTWTIPSELLVRIVERAPESFAKYPVVVLGIAVGPPEDPETAAAIANGECDKELLEVATGPELERLFTVAEVISAERSEKMNRMRHAVKAKDHLTVVKIAAELCGVPDEKEEGHRTHPRIN